MWFRFIVAFGLLFTCVVLHDGLVGLLFGLVFGFGCCACGLLV